MVEADGAASTEAVAEPLRRHVPLATRVWSVFAAATRELLRTVPLLGPAASGGALAGELPERAPAAEGARSPSPPPPRCSSGATGGASAAAAPRSLAALRNSGAILAQFGAILLTAVLPYRYAVVAVALVGLGYLAEGGAAPSCSGGAWRNSAQFCAQLSQALYRSQADRQDDSALQAVKLWGQQADIEAAELDVIYNQLHRKYAPGRSPSS